MLLFPLFSFFSFFSSSSFSPSALSLKLFSSRCSCLCFLSSDALKWRVDIPSKVRTPISRILCRHSRRCPSVCLPPSVFFPWLLCSVYVIEILLKSIQNSNFEDFLDVCLTNIERFTLFSAVAFEYGNCR